MKYSIFVFSLLFILQTHAQTDTRVLSEADIAKHTRYFTFEDQVLKGPGAKMLAQIAKKSQFVIVGETHGSSQTSNLVAAWLPTLNKHGFDYFACEVGPHSANVLAELSTPAAGTKENLRNFHEQYYMEELDDGTIPFFDGVEDAQFLQVASEQGMELWGLDQEYYYSILHLTKELVNTTRNASNHDQVVKAKIIVDKIIYQYYIKEDTSADDFDAFTAILEDAEVNQFFNLFDQNNEAAQSMISAIKTSFDIYINWQRGSHADRVSYMRNNLLNEIKNAKRKSDALPKVFLKFGQAHASKIISNGAYDLGHAIQELACQTGTKAVNIALARRYINHNGKMIDLLGRPRNPYGKKTSLIAGGKQDEAAIVDLSAIRCDLRTNNSNLQLPSDGDYHRIKQILDGFDYLIILPVDQRQQRLF